MIAIEQARAWLDRVEAALVARAMGNPTAAHGLGADEAAAGRAAVAAKFLAVGTPRTLGLVAVGGLAGRIVAAQIAYAAPRELRVYEEAPGAADMVIAAIAGELAAPRPSARAVALRLACACDIVVVAGPVTIEREWIRAGTLVTVLDGAVVLDPALLAAADVYASGDAVPAGVRLHATLAAVATGLVDGRSLDEITVLLP